MKHQRHINQTSTKHQRHINEPSTKNQRTIKDTSTKNQRIINETLTQNQRTINEKTTNQRHITICLYAHLSVKVLAHKGIHTNNKSLKSTYPIEGKKQHRLSIALFWAHFFLIYSSMRLHSGIHTSCLECMHHFKMGFYSGRAMAAQMQSSEIGAGYIGGHKSDLVLVPGFLLDSPLVFAWRSSALSWFHSQTIHPIGKLKGA